MLHMSKIRNKAAVIAVPKAQQENTILQKIELNMTAGGEYDGRKHHGTVQMMDPLLE
jgi:hypothetical protein